MRNIYKRLITKKWVFLGLVVFPFAALFLSGFNIKKPSLGDIGNVVDKVKTVKKVIVVPKKLVNVVVA